MQEVFESGDDSIFHTVLYMDSSVQLSQMRPSFME